MFVVRRVWTVQPGKARQAASYVEAMGQEYQDAGKRSASRVYFNGGTMPGDRNRVYMEWTADVLDSPYREGNVIPQSVRDAGAGTRDLVINNYIEFYELMTPAKFQE